jgi:hypothetical protein
MKAIQKPEWMLGINLRNYKLYTTVYTVSFSLKCYFVKILFNRTGYIPLSFIWNTQIINLILETDLFL